MSCRKLAVLISGLALLAFVCEAVPAPLILIKSEKQKEVAVESKQTAAAPAQAIEADDLKPAASGYWGHSYGHGYGHGHGHGHGYWGGHYPYLGGFYGGYPYAGYGYGGYGSYGHGLYGGYGGYWL